MASQLLPKLRLYIPLWRRMVPKYPLWWKGNPQLRVFMPLFWMKLYKTEFKMPPNFVAFEVHRQMTDYDIKNYLEKIYNVPVLTVRTHLEKGVRKTKVDYEDDKRIAYVQLTKGHKFEWPDLTQGKKTDTEKTSEQYNDAAEKLKHASYEQWDRSDVPPWFR